MSLRAISDTTNCIVLFWLSVTLILYGIFQNPFWMGVAFMIIWFFASVSTIQMKRSETNKLK